MDEDHLSCQGRPIRDATTLVRCRPHRRNLQDFWKGFPLLDRTIIDGFWCGLSNQRKKYLNAFLNSCTMDELDLLRSRICVLETEKLFELLGKFRDESDGTLCCYLRVAVASPTQFKYDTSFTSSHDTLGGPKDSANCEDGSMKCSILDYQITFTSDKIYSMLPQEIYDTIVEILFEAVYLPGSVVPDQFPVFDDGDCFSDVKFCIDKSRALRRLDENRYTRFKKDYWTKNIWQIRIGCSSDILDFLHMLPTEYYLSIRSVSLTFSGTCHDTGFSVSYYDETSNLFENLCQLDEDCRRCAAELQHQWFWAFEITAALKLESLILDFQNAYSVTGEFLGVKVSRDFHRFSYGLPRLVIKAPSKRLEEKIYDIIVAQNTKSY